MRRFRYGVVFLLAALCVAGCSSLPTPGQRARRADSLAAAAGWRRLRLPCGDFVLTAYALAKMAAVPVLTVYIEGDGLAWLTPSTPSADPTPLNPLALKLALRQRWGAVYLARPCQYVTVTDRRKCAVAYWTDRRFAPEVVAATDRAIDQLKRRFAANRVVLVGYSGGGAVAALVAARRQDVARLVTVAGNLDTRAWAAYHRIPALAGSLNPADAWRALENVPQRHFVGGKDSDVPPAIAHAYAARFPPAKRPPVVVVPGFDHACCWVQRWPALLPTNGRGRQQ